MTSRRIALIAALTAAASWTAKSVAIGTAGGLGKSPFEQPLYLLGLLSFVVAAVALGIAVTAGRPSWLRGASGVGSFVAGFVLTMLVDGAVAAFHAPGPDRHWVWTELNLWVASVGVVVLAVAVNRSAPAPSTRVPSEQTRSAVA